MTKDGKNKKSGKGNQKDIVRIISGTMLIMLLMIGLVYGFFSAVFKPVKVFNSLAYLDDDVIEKMMQPAVSDALANKKFKVIVDGNENEFCLGDYEYTYSVKPSGTTEVIDYIDNSNKPASKIVRTVGNLCFNETSLRKFIHHLTESYGTPMIEPYYDIEGDVLMVYRGTDGMGIDFDDFTSTIKDRINSNDYSSITKEIRSLTAPDVDIDIIYRSVKCSALDATVKEDAAGNPMFTEDVIGKDFDLNEAKSILENSPSAESWEIPLDLTYPAVTLKELRAPYCLDKLSSCTTKYVGSSNERANNVEKAADYINNYGDFTDGYILQPGEEFSYNKAVGQRTAARGFMKAPVYVASGATDDFGGGICQVSTTLYCAVLYANLEITERHNHFYVIHYWPTEGCDATVDWGRLDFKFKNNKEYPIKIKCTYEKRRLTVTISGTSDGITAKMDSKVLTTTPFKTVYRRPTAAYPEGTVTSGDPGKTVDVWRSVYMNGEFVSRVKESSNLYYPMNRVVYTNNLPDGAEYAE